MDTDNFYNPLAYDEQVVAEKLGLYEYAPKPKNVVKSDINASLELALLKADLSNDVPCKCGRKIEKFQPDINNSDKLSQPTAVSELMPFPFNFDMKTLLVILVLVLIAICVAQYVSYGSRNDEVMKLLQIMMLRNAGVAPTNPVAV